MIVDAINKIIEMAASRTITIGERKYVDGKISPVLLPTPISLKVHTLSGIVDYLTKETDPAEEGQRFIHVVSPTEVKLCGGFYCASFYERPEFLTALFQPAPYQQGKYFNLEDFIIGLQAYFVRNEMSSKLLDILCNITEEASANYNDNGITQNVTAKTGISLVQSVPVPNPVVLRPFRTFPEIEQPESLFVFRIKRQQGQPPLCGLWEADNKQWKIEAVQGIAKWLQDKLPEIPIIA